MLPPSADGESPAEVQRKTPRPLGANPLTQFVCPGQPVQRKEPPVRANTLTQFAHPAQPVQEKVPPVRANTPAAVRAPRSAGAENPGNPEKIFPPEKAAKTPVLTLRNGYPNGIVSKT